MSAPSIFSTRMNIRRGIILPLIFLSSRFSVSGFHHGYSLCNRGYYSCDEQVHSKIIMKLNKKIGFDAASVCPPVVSVSGTGKSKKKKDICGGGSGDSGVMRKTYTPRTPLQAEFVDYLNDPDVHILFGMGPAGCGKTLFACYTAIQALKSGAVQKIVLTRPIVPVDEDLGFLPGSLIAKMDPWTRPIFDIMLEFYTQAQIDNMVEQNIIEISPLAYMRGRTFKNTFIIADEMQNSSPNQMLMMTTRVGEGSKMVITGDLNQSDRGSHNGLSDFIHKYKSAYIGREDEDENPPYIRFVEMTSVDIQRSIIVTKILKIYDAK